MWAATEKQVACTATEPDTRGAWTCEANLLALDVPPGVVTFTFDVYGAGVPPARSPDGSRDVTYSVAPPKPTHVSLTKIAPPVWEDEHPAGTYRVDWSAPAGYADEFLVYFTNECPPSSTEANAGKPCFVAGTPVDVSKLRVLARVPGDARSIDVRIPESECEGIYGSVLLRARNTYGRSKFAIVKPALVVWLAPGDIYC